MNERVHQQGKIFNHSEYSHMDSTESRMPVFVIIWDYREAGMQHQGATN
jgi:hypothetical protein